ncbi:MAG: hypothetical protein QOA19_00315 [Nitrososphaeraceae archaeon]|nr:hypothetical protein [Nitrososphaeraceae archaeon]MDW0181469.1 hypothetical protein [Nitrososphaeraceae archaeon]MDW0192664.1 hypothetical protein [Nitrososphaeraceae archaeon]MDW0200976.1 hypothetical protein [Nitrososphaeraceae archaeon]MDW0207638.1 hypothetical protein [Nitrososphaeraceae archaeon]
MNLKVDMRRISEFIRKQKISQEFKVPFENGLQPLEISRADMRRWFENEESISYYNPLQETILKSNLET